MSTLLTITNLTKAYGPRVILDGASLSVGDKQKIGVIGRNGAGKSTLFKIIVGDEEADSGEVIIHNGTRLGYLTQHDPYQPEETVMGFLERFSGKENWQCAKIAGKFQLKHDLLDRPIGTLAGGFQMRVKLAGILLKEPNLLLLDEPTNYLDLSTQILLEQFLQTYRGSFLLISHDREFLKNTCAETLEVDRGKTSLYPRPLEEYLAFKEEQQDLIEKHNKKIERQKRHLQTFVDRFRYKAAKASQAQSKIKQIAKLKTIDILHPMSTAEIRIPKVDERKGTALHTNDLSIGYGEKSISDHITLDITRGEHIAIVGDNGQGKSTFLKTVAGDLPRLSGTFRWGPHIKIGYYAQHVGAMLKPEMQVKTYLISKAAAGTKTEQVLEMAGNFLFRDDDLNKSASMLSGGEKARLCLAGLMLEKNDALLLDEPTNHLDFETVEALALALSECNATVIFISHNRTFVNVVATGIIEVKNGRVTRYLHNYEEYVYFLGQELGKAETEEKAVIFDPVYLPVEKEERERLREEVKELKKQLRDVEENIMDLEKEKQKLLGWFEKHQEYSRENTQQLKDTAGVLEEKEARWLKLQEEIETRRKRIEGK